MIDAGVVIAASGFSRRFADGDKLLADLHGRPLCDYVAETVAALRAREAVGVIPTGAPERAAVFEARGLRIVENPSPERGLGRTIALGVAALPTTAMAYLICLADTPFINVDHLARLSASLGDADAAVSAESETHAPPVVFAGRHRDKLLSLDGDGGARSLIRTLPRVIAVDAPSGSLRDIDTVEALTEAAHSSA